MFFPNVILTEHFEFRNYTIIPEQDSYALWKARNEESIRSLMENSEPFTYESHCNFMKTLSEKSDRIYYAVYQHNIDGGGS